MTLIKSISGIRGTIGGKPGDGLTPIDIVKYTAAYATFVQNTSTRTSRTIVVGRDARLSGEMVSNIVCGTLVNMGFDVVNIGLASTPTTEIAVVAERACGGVIITASHNPMEWNALKLLNERGEFLNAEDGAEVLRIANDRSYTFASVDSLGTIYQNTTYNRQHIDRVLAMKLVDVDAIRAANFTVAVDAVNSVGGIVIPQLLRALGVKNIIEINCTPTGHFQHNPEPIPENLHAISDVVRESDADIGFVVDPDVDRLAIVQENGAMFGEEYTLVAVADYVLSLTPGPTVSNISSTRALRDITRQYGCPYVSSAVGEVNVTSAMRRSRAVIGGEGNGGVIYPDIHYGRDSLVGVALFLTLLAKSGLKVSELRKKYPEYSIYKTKVQLPDNLDFEALCEAVKPHFPNAELTEIDGCKFDFPEGWVLLRKSNTEPIMRIYAEDRTPEKARKLADTVKAVVIDFIEKGGKAKAAKAAAKA